MRPHQRLTLTSLAAAAALLVAGSAAAHAHLVQSTPAANATVAAPRTISLTFDKTLTPAFCGLELTTADGVKTPLTTTVSKDHLTIVGTPKAKLAAGAYTIAWHAASADDGHRKDGALTFTVK